MTTVPRTPKSAAGAATPPCGAGCSARAPIASRLAPAVIGFALLVAAVARAGSIPDAAAGPSRLAWTPPGVIETRWNALVEPPDAGLWPDAGVASGAPLALANPYLVAPSVEVRVGGGRKKSADPARARKGRRPRRLPIAALTPERAQALLRSMTLPGWGQATLGHRTAGTVFGVLESGVWGSFVAFRVQEKLRRDASARTARIFAGVDLKGRDEEFRRLVGAFASSAEYNQLVVFRDAANLFYDDPPRYRAYIALNSVGGANAWAWQSEASFLRYGAQRKDAQRAALRSNTALALAVGNRILSVLHTARVASRGTGAAAPPRSWNFEVQPADGNDPTAFRAGLRATF